MKYKAKKGTRINDKDAQVIGKHFESLGKEIKTEKIVESATSLKSPIHKYFEWDDTEAGRLFRLQQARNLMESLVVDVRVEGQKVEQRAYFSVKTPNSKAYVSVKVAIEVPDYRKQLLSKAITLLTNLQVTLRMLREQ